MLQVFVLILVPALKYHILSNIKVLIVFNMKDQGHNFFFVNILLDKQKIKCNQSNKPSLKKSHQKPNVTPETLK